MQPLFCTIQVHNCQQRFRVGPYKVPTTAQSICTLNLQYTGQLGLLAGFLSPCSGPESRLQIGQKSPLIRARHSV